MSYVENLYTLKNMTISFTVGKPRNKGQWFIQTNVYIVVNVFVYYSAYFIVCIQNESEKYLVDSLSLIKSMTYGYFPVVNKHQSKAIEDQWTLDKYFILVSKPLTVFTQKPLIDLTHDLQISQCGMVLLTH